MATTSIRYVPELRRYCLTWRTATMPASAFWYFDTLAEAQDAAHRMAKRA